MIPSPCLRMQKFEERLFIAGKVSNLGLCTRLRLIMCGASLWKEVEER